MKEGFLVVDAGSGSVKTFFISPKGELLRSSESLWNRDNWTADKARPIILQTIRNMKLDYESTTIHGISVTSMREEFVLLDKDGKEVQYKLSPSSQKHGEKTLQQYGEAMYESSGHWPVPNWITGSILPWLLSERKDKMSKVSSVLMISDWVNHILCGETYTDGTSACETALYNISTNDWGWNLINELGLPPSIFPEVKSNASRIGQITQKISSISGLPTGIPVLMGGADTQCGLLGMGTGLHEVAAVGGTTTPVQLIVDSPIIDSKKRTWSNNHLIPDQWIVESNSGYTGRGVRWARENLGYDNYDQLNEEASKIKPGSDGLLSYLGPHKFNAGPPFWEMDKLGDLPVKQTTHGINNPNRAVQSRSIIESNCYAVKANLDQICEITGQKVSEIKFCGGNSKSKLWMQVQADVLDLPVRIPQVHDSTAIGTAILASVGSGYYSSISQGVSEMVKQRPVLSPNPENVVKYRHYFRKWMDTRKDLANL